MPGTLAPAAPAQGVAVKDDSAGNPGGQGLLPATEGVAEPGAAPEKEEDYVAEPEEDAATGSTLADEDEPGQGGGADSDAESATPSEKGIADGHPYYVMAEFLRTRDGRSITDVLSDVHEQLVALTAALSRAVTPHSKPAGKGAATATTKGSKKGAR